MTCRRRKTEGRSAQHLNTRGWKTCAELSKEKLNVLRSSAIITNLSGLPTRVNIARLGKLWMSHVRSWFWCPKKKKKKACVWIGSWTTWRVQPWDGKSDNWWIWRAVSPVYPFCSHTCRYTNACSTSPICPSVKTAPEPRSCSPHHLTGATASGRVYHPILVQLNVSTPDAWPCLPGAPGSSVHRQLMANPRSESGQLFVPNAARMPPAAINAGRQETCLTHSAGPLKRLTLEGLDSQQKGILKWTEPEMLQWFTD